MRYKHIRGMETRFYRSRFGYLRALAAAGSSWTKGSRFTFTGYLHWIGAK